MNVLISSAGRRVALLRAFRDSLTVTGGTVWAADASRVASACVDAGRALQVPRVDTDAFVPFMLDFCEREGIGLIVPTIDPELPVYAENRARFAERGVHVHVSSPEVIAISSDKRRTHQWLVDNGFPTVEQTDLSKAVQNPETCRPPRIAKPARGSSSVGVRTIRAQEDLAALDESLDYLVQSVAPGVEYTVDAFVDERGACACTVPRQRIETRAGEVSKAVTRREPELQELVRRLVEALPGARGVLNVQVFLDTATGVMSVIEINARFGGGVPLSVEAGADFPGWVLAMAKGKVPPVSDAWRDGRVMLRFDDAVFTDSDEVGL